MMKDLKKLQDIDVIEGSEGTKIRQIFHPHNTFSGIRYSISHSVVAPGKKSKLHKMKTSEVYYILEGERILFKILTKSMRLGLLSKKIFPFVFITYFIQ